MSTIVLIKRIKKFIPSSHYFKIYHSLFISHLTYGISCWGGICPGSKLIKMFNIQKRCVRILFGDKYSFDHPEYYLTCARARTYMDHTSLKDYSLEHTKPIFNKHKLLTLNNLYVLRSLAELIKILKSHTPISMFKFLQFCPRSHHYRLLIYQYTILGYPVIISLLKPSFYGIHALGLYLIPQFRLQHCNLTIHKLLYQALT